MANALANALVPIFAGLLLGFWAGRRGWMDNGNVRNLIALVMNVAIPCAMFSIISRSSREVLERQWSAALIIALAFGAIYAACYLWARRVGKMSIPDAAVEALTIGFPNSAAIGLPLLAGVLGSEAAVTAALSIAVGSITLSPVTLAMLDMTGDKEASTFRSKALFAGLLHSFRRPVVWSPVLALVFVASGAHFPSYVTATLKTLGSASTGSALLLTGLVISAQPIKADGSVVWATFGKLVAQPLLAIALCLLLHLDHDQLRDIALLCAVPAGFFGIVFGEPSHAEPEVASSSLIVTNVLSVFTLPLWLLILK